MSNALTKQDLIENGYDWVDVIDETLDKFIYETLDVLRGENPIFNPFLVETNLRALSESISKSLSLKNAIYDLEEQAIRQALEYYVFKQNFQHVKDIEKASWITDQLKAEKSAHQKTLDTFSGLASSELAEGHAAEASARIVACDNAITGENSRHSLVDKKWVNTEWHQEALEKRHKEFGNPLNYKERAGKLRNLLREELISLYWYAQAVSAGFKAIYGLEESEAELPLVLNPSDDSPGFKSFLDEIAIWTRIKARWLSEHKQQETLYDLTICASDTMHDNKSLYDDSTFESLISNSGILRLDLSDYFPEELGKLRLKGIGVSFRFGETVYAKENAFTRVVVIPPSQNDPYNPSSSRKITPQVIDHVALIKRPSASVNYVLSPTFENIDPSAGTWEIRLADYLTGVEKVGYYKRKLENIDDVRLHLKLSSNPDNNEANWEARFWS